MTEENAEEGDAFDAYNTFMWRMISWRVQQRQRLRDFIILSKNTRAYRVIQRMQQHCVCIANTCLLGRRISKRFMYNNRLTWFGGEITCLFWNNHDFVVGIQFDDGDYLEYPNLLREKVVIILPQDRNNYKYDSQQFSQRLVDNEDHPLPRPGTYVFINHNNTCVKGYVKEYDHNTEKHKIEILSYMGQQKVVDLHLGLGQRRGPRWCWFCDSGDDHAIVTPPLQYCRTNTEYDRKLQSVAKMRKTTRDLTEVMYKQMLQLNPDDKITTESFSNLLAIKGHLRCARMVYLLDPHVNSMCLSSERHELGRMLTVYQQLFWFSVICVEFTTRRLPTIITERIVEFIFPAVTIQSCPHAGQDSEQLLEYTQHPIDQMWTRRELIRRYVDTSTTTMQ